MGAVAATYGPGVFSLVNAVAGAYAERVPVVVISGGPRTQAYDGRLKLHHLLPDNVGASLKIFEQITEAAELIGSADDACGRIDTLLRRCWQSKRPSTWRYRRMFRQPLASSRRIPWKCKRVARPLIW